MRTIQERDRGEDVRDVQHRLVALGLPVDALELEGMYGASTAGAVRAFQQRRGLLVDGRVGPETWSELVEAGYALGDRILYLRYPLFRGDDVRALQRRLNALGFDTGREDGIFGERCDRAVREFQRNVGREPDGIVGPDTLRAVERLRPAVDAPSRAMVREAEAVSRLASSLIGARVAVDAGHGPGDPGISGPGGALESDLALLLAEELRAELAARGGDPVMLRESGGDPTPRERALRANEQGAEVCISIHLNGADDPAAEGASCYYFGTDATHSPAGHRLADLIQDELTSRMGLVDGRIHRLSVPMLRETRMPAVQVEPCFLTNPREERLLADAGVRRDVAIAIRHGVERFLGKRSETGSSRALAG